MTAAGDFERPTQSAVIVPVAAAEPVVGAHRSRFDIAASWGVPAHVTIVYPFADPAGLSDAVLARLAAAVASVPAFACTFARCDWFDEDVLWLAPEPDDGFRALTAAVVAEFPQHQPYGGIFDDAVPHLTVGERRLGSAAELCAAQRAVTAALPITVAVEHAVLITGAEAPDSWRTIRRLPLGDGTAGDGTRGP